MVNNYNSNCHECIILSPTPCCSEVTCQTRAAHPILHVYLLFSHLFQTSTITCVWILTVAESIQSLLILYTSIQQSQKKTWLVVVIRMHFPANEGKAGVQTLKN